jgi:uncharacterized sporulation protein YeaH/YhbH (DUF444 family)
VLKKKITYENPFTGMEHTEEFYFHLSKADLVRMEVEEHQETYTAKYGTELTGMQARLQRIVDSEDGKAMMPVFEDIIRRTYGRKDGDRFIRSEVIWEDFRGSGAFDALLFELCTDAGAAAEFVNGAIPANLESLAKEIQAQAAAQTASKKPAAKKKAAVKEKPEDRAKAIAEATADDPITLTQEEMVSMESSDLQTGLASGKFKLA